MKQKGKPDAIHDQSILEEHQSSDLTHVVMLWCFEIRYEPFETKPQSSWDINVVWTTNEWAAVVSETRCIDLESDAKRLASHDDHTSKSSCWAWPGWKEGLGSIPAKSAPFMVWKAGVGGLDASKEWLL